MTDPDRPYPEGIAWDEAWRQRQRADQAERCAAYLWGFLTGVEHSVEEYHERIRRVKKRAITHYGFKEDGE